MIFDAESVNNAHDEELLHYYKHQDLNFENEFEHFVLPSSKYSFFYDDLSSSFLEYLIATTSDEIDYKLDYILTPGSE